MVLIKHPKCMWCIYSPSTQEPPKYKDNYVEICPVCGERITLSCNGPPNMKLHVGRARCLVAQKRKGRMSKVKPQGTLPLDMFKPRPQVVSTVVGPDTVIGK